MFCYSGLLFSRARKAAFLLIVIVAVLAVSTYAYLRSLPPVAGPKVYVKSSAIEFSLALDKSEYRLGENLTITFYAVNISNKTIEIHKPSLGGFTPPFDEYFFSETHKVEGSHLNPYTFHFGYLIEYMNGTEFTENWWGEFQMTYWLSIRPGGYIRQTVIHPSGGLLTLYPNAYRLRAHFGYIKEDSESIDLETRIIFSVR